MPLDTAGVNRVLAELPGAIRSKLYINIAQPLLTDDPSDTASDNYGIVGGAGRLWNAINKHPVDHPLDWQAIWWMKFFAVRLFMRGEQLSLIYTRHHVEALLAARGAFVFLRWSSLVALADEWLLAAAGYMTLGAGNGKPFVLSAADQKTVGPIVLVGRTAPPRGWAGLRPVAWAGHRSAVQKALRAGDADGEWSMSTASISMLFGIALAERKSDLVDAMRSRGVWTAWLSAPQVAIAIRAIKGDLSARLLVVNWIRSWPLDHPTVFDLTETWCVSCVLLDGKGGSTSPCEVSSWSPAGHLWAVANDGSRGNVGSTTAQIDWTTRGFTAQRDDRTMKAISGKLALGKSVFRVLSGGGKVAIQVGGGQVTAPSGGGQVPEVDAPSKPPTEQTPPSKPRYGCPLSFVGMLIFVYGLAWTAALLAGRLL